MFEYVLAYGGKVGVFFVPISFCHMFTENEKAEQNVYIKTI